MSGILVDEHSFLLENAELARVLNGISSPPRCADHGRPAMATPFRYFPVDFMPENVAAMSSIHPAAMVVGRRPISLTATHTDLDGEEMLGRRMQEVGFADEEELLCRRMQEAGFFADEEKARQRQRDAAGERERGREGYAEDVQAAMMTMMAMMIEGGEAARDRVSLQRFLPSNNEEWLAESMDYCASDEFRMYEFKVRRCMRGRSHDWTECPFAHPGEKARRRDPRRFHYAGTGCPDFRKGACRRGDACEFSHGVFECWLHPARYRTQLCKDGKLCKRRVCFFAHSPSQLRLVSSPSPSMSSPSSSPSPSPNLNDLLLRRGAVSLPHGVMPASLSYADGSFLSTSPSINLYHEISSPRISDTAVGAYEDCAPFASPPVNLYQETPPNCREAMGAEGCYQIKQACPESVLTTRNSMYPMEGKPATESFREGSPFRHSMREPHSKNGMAGCHHTQATMGFNGPFSYSCNELSPTQATGASMGGISYSCNELSPTQATCASMGGLPRFSDVISNQFGSKSMMDVLPSFRDVISNQFGSKSTMDGLSDVNSDQFGSKSTRPTHLSLLNKLSGGCSQLPSPTSTLIGHSPSPPPLSPPLSPCESPPMSPSLSSNLGRRILSVSSQAPSDANPQIHSLPTTVGATNSMACAHGPSPLSCNSVANRRSSNPVGAPPYGHMEAVLDQSLQKASEEGQGTNHLAPIFQQMELRRAATKMHKLKSAHLAHSVSGSPNSRWGEAWDANGCTDPPAFQRVESGRELRARIYGKLGREVAQENESPDLGWVNELVK